MGLRLVSSFIHIKLFVNYTHYPTINSNLIGVWEFGGSVTGYNKLTTSVSSFSLKTGYGCKNSRFTHSTNPNRALPKPCCQTHNFKMKQL